MSALGEYVHYRVHNYLSHGVWMGYGSNNLAEIILKTRSDMQTKINSLSSVTEDTLRILRKRLHDNSLSQEEKDLFAIDTNFDKRVNTVWESVARVTSQNALNAYRYASKKGTKNNAWLYTEAKKVSSLAKENLQKLNKMYQKIEETGMASEEELKKILKIYNKVNKTRYKNASLEHIKSLMGQMQEKYDNLYFQTIEQQVAGSFGESLVAMCDDVADNLSKREAFKFIDSAVIGQNTSKFSVDEKQIIDISQEDSFKNFYKANATKNKVDVTITINREPIVASVKNYRTVSIYKNIHLQNIDLIYTLIALNENNFGTHWMNLHALKLNKYYTKQKNDVDSILTTEIAYEALVSGNPLKRNQLQANTFIFLDRNKGTVYAQNTKDILNNDMNKIKITPSIGSILLENRYAKEGPYTRIARLLSQIHTQKIKVALIPDKTN